VGTIQVGLSGVDSLEERSMELGCLFQTPVRSASHHGASPLSHMGDSVKVRLTLCGAVCR
jgi:hypothetical protein